MSFAQNFALGQQIAQKAVDAFEKARQRKEIKEIQSATVDPMNTPAYTSEDASQMQALANAKDANGNTYYKMEAMPDGSYGVRPNFAYQGQDGQQVEAGGLVQNAFRPRDNVATFLGKRYDAAALNDDRVEALRSRALADVVTKYDPEKGIGLRMQTEANERANRADSRAAESHQWSADDRPMRQKLLEQQVNKGEYDERQWSRNEKVQQIKDQVAGMTDEQLQLYAQRLNTNGSELPFLYVGKNKSGYQFTTIDPQTGEVLGKQHSLSSADLRQMAVASALGMAGYGDESMSLLRQANKDIADAIDRHNRTTQGMVNSQNSALSSARSDSRGDAQLGLAQRAADRADNPWQANVESAQRLLKRQLTADEVERMVGLAKENALTLKEIDGNGVFVDSRGTPVGKYDPQMGMVPHGAPDPRGDEKLSGKLADAGVKVVSVQSKNGVQWGYKAADGRVFANAQDAIDPPPNPEGVSELSQLKGLLDQEQKRLVAVGKSGDQRAIAAQSQRVQGLQTTLRAAAEEKFGKAGASKYFSQN